MMYKVVCTIVLLLKLTIWFFIPLFVLLFIRLKNECVFALIANHEAASGGTEDEIETDTLAEVHRLCLASTTRTGTL